MKLILIFTLMLSMASAYGVSCGYLSSSAQGVKALCEMTVDGQYFKAVGHSSISDLSMARSMACAECRSQLTQNLPEDIQKKYRNPDGSFTLGLNGLVMPKKVPDLPPTKAPIQQDKIGEQDEKELSCMKVSKYAYCSDGNFYEPVGQEKNSQLRKIVARVLSGQRNMVKKVPAPEDGDGDMRSHFDH